MRAVRREQPGERALDEFRPPLFQLCDLLVRVRFGLRPVAVAEAHAAIAAPTVAQRGVEAARLQWAAGPPLVDRDRVPLLARCVAPQRPSFTSHTGSSPVAGHI